MNIFYSIKLSFKVVTILRNYYFGVKDKHIFLHTISFLDDGFKIHSNILIGICPFSLNKHDT